jgi:hypothetical protein
MKKLFTVVFTMLLAGSLAFAQTGGGSTGDAAKTKKGAEAQMAPSGKKATKTKKAKGGSKKHKKGSSTAPTAPTK